MVNVKGLEETCTLIREMREGISEIVSAFLFFDTKTRQIFVQKYDEVTDRFIPYKDRNIIYCGKLSVEDQQQDILNKINSAEDYDIYVNKEY